MNDIFLCGHKGHERALEIASLLRKARTHVNFAFSCRVQDIKRETMEALKAAGLYNVSFGVETIDTGSLKLLQKGNRLEAFERAFSALDDLGISVSTYMMLYHPFTSIEEICNNYRFLRAAGLLDYAVSPDRRAFELL